MHTAKTHFAVCRKKTLGKIHLCRVPEKRHSAKTNFVECFFLPSVFYLALGKDRLCRVPDKIHSAKPPALGKDRLSRSGRRQEKIKKHDAVQACIRDLPQCVQLLPVQGGGRAMCPCILSSLFASMVTWLNHGTRYHTNFGARLLC